MSADTRIVRAVGDTGTAVLGNWAPAGRLVLQPFPDALLEGVIDVRPGPEARYEQSESISLAFVTALQVLPSRQLAVLILRDVLGFHPNEVAGMLDSTVESVNGALKRARATLHRRQPSPPGRHDRFPAANQLPSKKTASSNAPALEGGRRGCPTDFLFGKADPGTADEDTALPLGASGRHGS